MGMFNRKIKVVDMSEEKARKDFIDKKMAEEKPVMTHLLPKDLIEEKELPVPSPPEFEEEEENYTIQKTLIILEIETDNQELLMQMFDGVSEITKNFGADSIKSFRTEKM